MVSKHLRRHQSTGGQATGTESNATSSHRAGPDHLCTVNTSKKARRSSVRVETELSDSAEGEGDDEDELSEDSLQFGTRYGNQLGEIPDSERIDRIQAERKQLEVQAINNRDYVKKIEHRFFMGTKGQSLAQCNLELSSQVRALQETVKKKEKVFEQTQQERDEARDKLAIVQRALDMRLESYELNGSLHTGLLFEISKLQDHSEALALQLAQERKQVSALGTQIKKSQKREEELEDARTVRETWVATLEKERAVLDEKLAQLSGDVQTAACEKATLLRFIHEQAEAKFQLEAKLKDEQAQRQQELEKAQHALQLWEDEKQQLKTSIQTYQRESEQQREEFDRVSATLREQQEFNSKQRAREAEMKLELERLDGARKKCEDDFLAAKDVCRELQTTVEQHEEHGRQLRSEIDALDTARHELLRQIETKQSEERALREAMEGALQDLAALSKQRNDAAKAMSEAVTISASSLEEQQALERQVEAQRSQIEKLKTAKNLLQNAMLEQLAALRKQLHVERCQRIEAEARLKHLKPLAGVSRTRHMASALPTAEIVGHHEDETDRRPPETVDWEAPQPLPPPSAPMPSPAPLPLYLSTSSSSYRSESDLPSALPSPSSSSSSSTSSSHSEDEVDICDALEDEFSRVTSMSPNAVSASIAQLPVDGQTETEADAHISLLELAGDIGT
ncbi:unnamed protein product [Phytophthora fragariaefolia]|uniref:Unnamed protein product n=1 Tax=Phytophthora fragariaefolia TaxID=1490495 RepID=A0A9W7CWY0_9STRA|nr:unnamed protein product [Phytophthora fragariaefolia]